MQSKIQYPTLKIKVYRKKGVQILIPTYRTLMQKILNVRREFYHTEKWKNSKMILK